MKKLMLHFQGSIFYIFQSLSMNLRFVITILLEKFHFMVMHINKHALSLKVHIFKCFPELLSWSQCALFGECSLTRSFWRDILKSITTTIFQTLLIRYSAKFSTEGFELYEIPFVMWLSAWEYTVDWGKTPALRCLVNICNCSLEVK